VVNPGKQNVVPSLGHIIHSIVNQTITPKTIKPQTVKEKQILLPFTAFYMLIDWLYW